MNFMLYEVYRNELRKQHKNVKGLADYLGETADSIYKKFQGVNPWRGWEMYGAMEYIEKPLYELSTYFTKADIESCA